MTVPIGYVFPLRLTVRRLSRPIEQIRLDHGDPGLEMDIIAHSMGGLIARYYLRYGE